LNWIKWRSSENITKMKILAINGSPRKGNTHKALKLLLENINAETELIDLIDYNIKMSLGDDVKVTDDCPKIHAKMKSADIIIFGSPSYFNNVTGLMKNFIDRSNAFWSNKELEGKKAILLAIGEEKIVHIKGCLDAMMSFARGVHMEVLEEIMFEDDKIIVEELKRVGELFEKVRE